MLLNMTEVEHFFSGIIHLFCHDTNASIILTSIAFCMSGTSFTSLLNEYTFFV